MRFWTVCRRRTRAFWTLRLTVTAYNYLKNENYKKAVRRALLTENFKPSTLYGLQIEGFKTAAVSPAATLKNHERGINSSSLAAVFPFVRTCVLDEGGILLGENKTNGYPFILNLWKRGNLYQNSNAMIIGKSGFGQIVFFEKRSSPTNGRNGTRVIVLDPEAEYLTLTPKPCRQYHRCGQTQRKGASTRSISIKYSRRTARLPTRSHVQYAPQNA